MRQLHSNEIVSISGGDISTTNAATIFGGYAGWMASAEVVNNALGTCPYASYVAPTLQVAFAVGTSLAARFAAGVSENYLAPKVDKLACSI